MSDYFINVLNELLPGKWHSWSIDHNVFVCESGDYSKVVVDVATERMWLVGPNEPDLNFNYFNLQRFSLANHESVVSAFKVIARQIIKYGR
jgi:hypothetical protein